MFIGHFGVGLAAKKVTHKPSLATLFFASQFIDLLWPILLMLGLEHVEIDPGNTVVTPLNFVDYPFSHSLVGVLFWGIVVGGIYYAFKRDKRNAIIVGLLVLSHWILDLFTHRPDLLLVPGGDTYVGMGLWNSMIGTIAVEGLIFALGVFYYLKVTRAKKKMGSWSFWSLIVFLVIIYISNLFGPPPPSADAIPYVGLAMWLFIPWAFWIDRNRGVVD